MAEPIGLASGLLTLIIFASQSTIALYKTIQSFRTHPKRVRDLAEELEALSGVLQSLDDTVQSVKDVDLSALDVPLLQCGKACKEFEKEILRCSARSGGDRTSFRDWAKLKYLGDNIDEFKHSLAGYKLTITIALNDVNLRKISVTADCLEDYRDLIKTATADLEARLETIDERLETAFARTATESESTELGRINEERLSTQKCLVICAQLSEHINQIQPVTMNDGFGSGSSGPNPTMYAGAFPETITRDGMRECKTSLDQTTMKLETHMRDLISQMIAKSNTTMTQDEIATLTSLQEQWTTARQCREICSRADKHLNENVSIIDNHATGDENVQFLVSTTNKTIHGKNRGYGSRIRQVGGHLSDESVQQLSRDISSISAQVSKKEKLSAQGDMTSAFDESNRKGMSEKEISQKEMSNKEMPWQNYGTGRKLVSQGDPNHVSNINHPDK